MSCHKSPQKQPISTSAQHLVPEINVVESIKDLGQRNHEECHPVAFRARLFIDVEER